MAEEVTMENQPETQPENQPEAQPDNTPSVGAKIWAAVKEWFRKKVVALKVKPQLIPLLVLVVTTIVFMLSLHGFSQAIKETFSEKTTKATGICIFITTLLSLLVLVSFLNAFPKRKKPNIFFIVLVFVMIAAMLACDIVYFVQMSNCIKDKPVLEPEIQPGQPYILAHIVLLGVSAIVLALLPVYSKLIKKIDTSIKLDSATEHMNGNIDIEEE